METLAAPAEGQQDMVDEFDLFIARSLSGGGAVRRLCKSLPSSPTTSPRYSALDENQYGQVDDDGDIASDVNGAIVAPRDSVREAHGCEDRRAGLTGVTQAARTEGGAGDGGHRDGGHHSQVGGWDTDEQVAEGDLEKDGKSGVIYSNVGSYHQPRGANSSRGSYSSTGLASRDLSNQNAYCPFSTDPGYATLLMPPDHLLDSQTQALAGGGASGGSRNPSLSASALSAGGGGGDPGGARPKSSRVTTSPPPGGEGTPETDYLQRAGHIRRTQSCRRPSPAKPQDLPKILPHKAPMWNQESASGNSGVTIDTSVSPVPVACNEDDNTGGGVGDRGGPGGSQGREASRRSDHGDYYRQRAQRNAWHQHSQPSRSTDDEGDLDSPGRAGPRGFGETHTAGEPPRAGVGASSLYHFGGGSLDSEATEDDSAVVGECKIYRVRSFTTTSGGIINRGDSFKIKSRRRAGSSRRSSRSAAPSPSDSPDCRSPTDSDPGESRMRRGSREMSINYRVPCTVAEDDDYHDDGGEDVVYQGYSHVPAAHSPQGAAGLGTGAVACEHNLDIASGNAQEYIAMAISTPDSQLVSRDPGNASSGLAQAASPMTRPQFGRLGTETGLAEDEEDDDEDEAQVFKVLVIGTNGVGKTTLTRQILTSEYLANSDSYQDDDNEHVKIVSVQLDEEESVVQFVDVQSFQDCKQMGGVDAYVVVYSVTDRNSFTYAQACLQDLLRKGAPSRKKVIIVVANKQELVRNRVVSENEGRSLASSRRCKYTEVSALLDHKVDELLVGILRQIRLKHSQNVSGRPARAAEEGEEHSVAKVGCLHRATLGLFWKLFRKSNTGTNQKSCEDLMQP